MTSSITTLKLKDRTRYFSQLLARQEGLSFAELVETVLDEYLSFATVSENGKETSVAMLMDDLWGRDETDRLALLGNRFPQMLTERERVLWQRIICETQWFWKVPIAEQPIRVSDRTFHFDRLRERIATYQHYTRDQMITCSNELRSQRETATAQWFGDGPNQRTFRAKLLATTERANQKLNQLAAAQEEDSNE